MTRFNASALAGVVSHQPGHYDVKHAMTDSWPDIRIGLRELLLT
jgi:hypothetical protein